MKFLIAAITIFLIGCDINPSEFGAEEAKSFSSKITYVRDVRSGLCFGLVASRPTGGASQTGMGITEVPCDSVFHLIKN